LKILNRLKGISFKFPRLTRRQIYLSFVRPILEYGDLLFDNCSDTLNKKLEQVQREFCLLITGAYKKTKHDLLLSECGLESLSIRRKQKKLIMLYKIINNLVPQYLRDVCPQLTQTRHDYMLRNINIEPILTHKTYYYMSFFPSTIRLWNQEDRYIKTANSLNTFKSRLKNKYNIDFNKLYLWHLGASAIYHSRLRLGLSGLNQHRKRYHFILEGSCPYCNARREDVSHYLLVCPTFAAHRQEMLLSIRNRFPEINIEQINKITLTNILLKGTGNFVIDKELSGNFVIDKELFSVLP